MELIRLNNFYFSDDYSINNNDSYKYIYEMKKFIITLKYSDDYDAINKLTLYSQAGKIGEVAFISNKSRTIIHMKDLRIRDYYKEMISDKIDYKMRFRLICSFSSEVFESNQIYKKIIRLNKIDKLLKENV